MTKVTEILAKIVGELPAIRKTRNEVENWEYRSIETITEAVRPKLVEHGITFMPRVVRTKKHKNPTGLSEWEVWVEWTVYGPEGDSIVIGPVIGLGTSVDAFATNIAMTAAWKYMLIQTFCIGGQAVDGDSTEHSKSKKAVRSAPKAEASNAKERSAMLEAQAAVRANIRKLADEPRKKIIEKITTEGLAMSIATWTVEQCASIQAHLDVLAKEGSE